MAEKDEEIPDEFIEIATDISQCNYNVRQFKKSHLNKHLRPAQHSRNHTVNRLSTQPNNYTQHLSVSSIKSRTMTQGLNKTLRFNSTFIHPQNHNKKIFFSKSNAANHQFTAGNSGFGRYHSEDKNIKVKQSNKLTKFEQKWSKQKLKQKSLEGWLNSILIQFCHNEYFDHKIANCALKKLGIDQNSLVAKGLKASNVTRLYRSLFVFGMGFNELTKDLSNGNVEIGKIIWKIYSIILQYCSKGNLQTVIGQIQRENELKVSELSGELSRKQQIIEKNEELNEKKNVQIYKEIKTLRHQNINLKNQKTVLLNQYSATQQAFGEQITLRLKFETKINQIYGLHRQLGMKHQKMHHELVKKVEQLKNESQKYFQIVGKISEYRQSQSNLRQQLFEKKEKQKRYTQHLQEANKQIINLSTKISNLQHQVDSLKILYRDVKVKEKQLVIEKANMQAIVEMRQKSAKQTFKEYQITLQENNRLYIMISDQRKTMEDYQKQKKNFNTKIISIVAQNSFNKRKLEETTKKNEQIQQKFTQLQQTIIKVRVENDVLQKSESTFKSHFDAVQEKIQQMHKLNMSQSEELTNIRVFQQGCEKMINEKNKELQKLKKQIQNKDQTIEQLKIKYLDLQSKSIILIQKLTQAENNLQLKEAKLMRAYQENEQKNFNLIKTNNEQAVELDKIRCQFQIVLREFKNQKFERSSLNAMYMQTLKTIQSKNIEQKSLRVKISLLQGDLSTEKSKYKILQRNMMKLIANFGLIQEKLQETLQKQRAIIFERAEYVHPMLLQDMNVRICDLHQIKLQNEEEVDDLKLQIQKQRAIAKQQLQTTASGLRWQISRRKVQNQRTVQALKNEIIYVKEQLAKQKKYLQQLQSVAESYKKKIFEKTTSEREQVYKFMVEEKSKQIDKMFKEMETLQDQLTTLKRQLTEEAIAREQDLISSQQQLKNIIQDSVRKQLNHEYDLKLRQAQRSIKADFNKKQNQIKLEVQNSIRETSIEQILKIKNISWEQIKALPSNPNKFNRTEFEYQKDEQRFFDRSRGKAQNQQQIQKRGNMGRLMKNAYKYYQH